MIFLESMSFWSSPKGPPPTTGVVELWKKRSPMELGGGRQKMDEQWSFTVGVIASDVPRNDKFLFILYSKNEFLSSPKGTPTTGVVQLW